MALAIGASTVGCGAQPGERDGRDRALVRRRDLVERGEHGEAAVGEVGLAHARGARAVDLLAVGAVLAGQEAPRETEVGNAGEPVAGARVASSPSYSSRSIRL